METKSNTCTFLTTSNRDAIGDLQDRLLPCTMGPPTHSCVSKLKVVLRREMMGGGVATGLDVSAHPQDEIVRQ